MIFRRLQGSDGRFEAPGSGRGSPRRVPASRSARADQPRNPGTSETRHLETANRPAPAAKPGAWAGTVVALLLLLSPARLLAQAEATESGSSQPLCIVLQGLGGTEEFDETFTAWAEKLTSLCREQLGAVTVHLDGRSGRRESLLDRMRQALTSPASPIWFFLVGHGNWDGRTYRFNIRGPDLKTEDFVSLFGAERDRPTFLVLGTSSSAPLAEALTGARRVVVSATRSPGERYPPLFFSFFLEGAASAEADRNMDHRVSLEELLAYCREKVESWYQERNQIQTEHPTLYAGETDSHLASLAYLSRPPERSYRTLEAKRLAPERTRLEREIEALKLRKPEMDGEEYYRQLERLLVELAQLNQRIRELEGEP